MTDPVRIFVGCSANGEDAESCAVLEYTLRKHATLPLEITWMMQSHDIDSPFYTDPVAGWQTQKWATPFSGFRWAIPNVCDYKGRAIYMDSDFIVRADIAELWNAPLRESKVAIAKGGGRFCCSLWDCSAVAKAKLSDLMFDPDSHQKMNSYWSRHTDRIQLFERTADWNCMDIGPAPLSYVDTRIKAIHYTRIEQQLQLKHAIPRLAAVGQRHWFTGKPKPNDWPGLQELFDGLLNEAVAAGYPVKKYTSHPPFGPYRIRGS